MELQDVKDDVIFKVGRNVLMFQHMEHIVKHLVANGSISAYHSELRSTHSKQRETVSKRTLGMVVGDFLESPKPPPAPDVLREPHFAISFSFKMKPEKKSEIEALVAERNHLIHHFLSDTNIGSIESLLDAARYLDSQCERLEKTISDLKSICESMSDGFQDMAQHVQTDEFRSQLKQNTPE